MLSLYARSFGVGYGGAGVFLAGYAFTRLLLDLGSGLLVDRFGERASTVGGFLTVAAASLLTGLAPAYEVAVVFWAVAGAGSALLLAALYSHLLHAVTPDRMARTLSIFYGAFNLGVVAGGFLGGVIAHRFGLASPLFVNAAVLVLSAALYVVLVPAQRRRAETHLGGRPPPVQARRVRRLVRRSGAELLRVLRTPRFFTVVVTNLAYLWMVAAVFDTLVPLFGRDELGMSTVGIGVVFAVALATEFLVLYPAGILADRGGRRPVLVPSLAALAVIIVALPWAGTPLALGALMAVLGVASGFAGVPPGAMPDVAPAPSVGTAVGLFRFFGDLGFTLGPLVAGFTTAALGFEGAFAIAAVPVVVALAFVVRTPETLHSAEATE